MNKQKQWSKKMREYAETFSPCSNKAQAINISVKLREMTGTIAEMMLDDHKSKHYAVTASALLRDAGLAEEVGGTSSVFGTFEFVDGSKLN